MEDGSHVVSWRVWVCVSCSEYGHGKPGNGPQPLGGRAVMIGRVCFDERVGVNAGDAQVTLVLLRAYIPLIRTQVANVRTTDPLPLIPITNASFTRKPRSWALDPRHLEPASTSTSPPLPRQPWASQPNSGPSSTPTTAPPAYAPQRNVAITLVVKTTACSMLL